MNELDKVENAVMRVDSQPALSLLYSSSSLLFFSAVRPKPKLGTKRSRSEEKKCDTFANGATKSEAGVVIAGKKEQGQVNST